MSQNTGTVTVVGNRYKFEGPFHQVQESKPIRKGDKLCGVTNPAQMTHVHSYGGEWVFFDGLTKGKLIGSRCENPKCETKGSLYMPFRIFCPDCLERNKPEDMTNLARESATVHTFMICERSGAFNTLKTPIKFINIEFEGTVTILMGYLSVGEPKMGMKVVPIFKTKNPTYTITDLSWVPAGTPANQLPEGFRF